MQNPFESKGLPIRDPTEADLRAELNLQQHNTSLVPELNALVAAYRKGTRRWRWISAPCDLYSAMVQPSAMAVLWTITMGLPAEPYSHSSCPWWTKDEWLAPFLDFLERGVFRYDLHKHEKCKEISENPDKLLWQCVREGFMESVFE